MRTIKNVCVYTYIVLHEYVVLYILCTIYLHTSTVTILYTVTAEKLAKLLSSLMKIGALRLAFQDPTVSADTDWLLIMLTFSSLILNSMKLWPLLSIKNGAYEASSATWYKNTRYSPQCNICQNIHLDFSEYNFFNYSEITSDVICYSPRITKRNCIIYDSL